MARRESDYSRPTVKRRGMRTGYTTGACAAAAAKAATIALLSGEPVREVTIRLPIGKDATFQIHRCEIDSGAPAPSAICSVIKDGGDDPDVTSGAEICARVFEGDIAIATAYADAAYQAFEAASNYGYAAQLTTAIAGDAVALDAFEVEEASQRAYSYVEAATEAAEEEDVEAAAEAARNAAGYADYAEESFTDSNLGYASRLIGYDELDELVGNGATFNDNFATLTRDSYPNADIEEINAVLDKARLFEHLCYRLIDEVDEFATRPGTVGIMLRGGNGVGIVTKPGTGIPVGDPSITRVPRRMITQAVQEAADSLGVVAPFFVEVSVPGGEEIAKKTDNPRLGIVDGISILGTTGVVQPFSTAAWRASVNVSIDVAAANSLPHMVITTGTQSELFAKRWLGLEDMSYVNVGIFTGAALKRCVQRGIPRATLVGMIGKFSKIAMGYFVTHVAGNKVDPVFLASLAGECGASEDVQAEMRNAASGRHFQEIALEHGETQVFDLMCERVCDAAQVYLGDRADDLIVDAICFDFEGGILGKATTADTPIPILEAVASDD